MSRTLHSDVVSALASGAYRYVNLVQIQWDSADGGTDYLTDAQFDITDGSDTYTASAFLMSSASVEESTKVITSSIDLSISGADQTYISAIFSSGYKYIDRKVVIKIALLNDSNAIIGNTVEVFSGRISGYKLGETMDSSIITFTVANHWEDFTRINGRKTNPTSQSKHFSSDKVFEFCSGLRASNITWGVGVDA